MSHALTLALASILALSGEPPTSARNPHEFPPVKLQDSVRTDWLGVGGMTTLVEILPNAEPIPENDNAGVLYEQVFAEMADPRPAPTKSRRSAKSPDDEDREQPTIARSARINLLREAATRPNCVWSISANLKPDEVTEWLRLNGAKAVNCAYALKSDAGARLAKNDVVGAWTSLEAALILADRLAQLPFWETERRSYAVYNITLMAMPELFNQIDPPPLEGVLTRLRNRQSRDSYRRALIGETALDLEIVRREDIPDPVPSEKWFDADLAVAQMTRAVQQIDKSFTDVDWHAFPTAEQAPRLGTSLAGKLGSVSRARAVFEARLQMAISALQLRQIKIDKGEYPKPAAWTPPANSMTGKPFAYVLTRNGFVLSTSIPVDWKAKAEIAMEWRWDR